MTLTPEQISQGWKLHDGSDVCPVKDDRTVHQIIDDAGWISDPDDGASEWAWSNKVAYRIIEAHGADAEPARPTPFPADYSDLVWDADGWSQTIIVDGKRPEWLRDDDFVLRFVGGSEITQANLSYLDVSFAIRVRRREPKRETVKGTLSCQGNFWPVSYDLIDGQPDLSTLKIAEDAL